VRYADPADCTWVTHMVQETPVLENAVAQFIVEYMEKENDVRQASLIQNVKNVKERRAVEARFNKEKGAREKAERERDEAVARQKALTQTVEDLLTRVQDLENRAGS